MRESPLVSGLSAPTQFVLKPTLLIALLLHAALLALPIASSSNVADDAATETTEDSDAAADFPPIDGMPDGEIPALALPPIVPKPVPSPAATAPATPRVASRVPANRTAKRPAARRPRQPARDANVPASEPVPGDDFEAYEASSGFDPLPEPEREETFRSNPFADFLLDYTTTNALDPSDEETAPPRTEPGVGALLGSLQLLKPELDRDAVNTPDRIEAVVETFPNLDRFQERGLVLAEEPEINDADGNFRVYKVTATQNNAERYLHLIHHYNRTILFAAPDPMTRDELVRQDTSTEDEQADLDRALETVKTTHLTAEVTLDELERSSAWPNASEHCSVQGKTGAGAPFPARALQRQLEDELASHSLYRRKNEHFYPGALLYTIFNGTKTFSRYLILAPVEGDRGTALLACRQLPGYNHNGR